MEKPIVASSTGLSSSIVQTLWVAKACSTTQQRFNNNNMESKERRGRTPDKLADAANNLNNRDVAPTPVTLHRNLLHGLGGLWDLSPIAAIHRGSSNSRKDALAREHSLLLWLHWLWWWSLCGWRQADPTWATMTLSSRRRRGKTPLPQPRSRESGNPLPWAFTRKEERNWLFRLLFVSILNILGPLYYNNRKRNSGIWSINILEQQIVAIFTCC